MAVSSGGLRVVEVTDPDLAEELDRTTHLAWAPALTAEQVGEGFWGSHRHG